MKLQLLQLLQHWAAPGGSLGCPEIRTCSMLGGAGRCCGHCKVVTKRCNMNLNPTTRINPYFCRHVDSPDRRGCLGTAAEIPKFWMMLTTP